MKESEEISSLPVMAVDQAIDSVEALEDETKDSVFMAGVPLPTYVDYNDAKVLAEVRRKFRAFDYDATDDAAKQFRTVDSLATYIEESIAEIRQVQMDVDNNATTLNGAMLARFWYMAERLNSALVSGKYGENVINELSNKIGLSKSMIYSVRAVATKLTPTDCWLLGVRGCYPTHLRRLAGVADDNTRTCIIKAFVESISQSSEKSAMEQARRLLLSACTSKAPYTELSTSDPNNGGADKDMYDTCMERMKGLNKLLAQLTNNDKYCDFRDSFGNIFVSSNMIDAQAKAEAAVTLAKQIVERIQLARVDLDELLGEAESLASGLDVTQA